MEAKGEKGLEYHVRENASETGTYVYTYLLNDPDDMKNEIYIHYQRGRYTHGERYKWKHIDVDSTQTTPAAKNQPHW